MKKLATVVLLTTSLLSSLFVYAKPQGLLTIPSFIQNDYADSKPPPKRSQSNNQTPSLKLEDA